MIRIRSIKSSLPSLYPLRHSLDKLLWCNAFLQLAQALSNNYCIVMWCIKSYLLQCFEVLDHSWISQCCSSLSSNSSPLVFIPIKTEYIRRKDHTHIHIVRVITVLHSIKTISIQLTPTFFRVVAIGPIITYPETALTGLFRASISLQLTSVLPVTCYVAVP